MSDHHKSWIYEIVVVIVCLLGGLGVALLDLGTHEKRNQTPINNEVEHHKKTTGKGIDKELEKADFNVAKREKADAIRSLKAIISKQKVFLYKQIKAGKEPQFAGTLRDLNRVTGEPFTLKNSVNGYFIRLQLVRKNKGFEAIALAKSLETNKVTFFADETGVITFTEDGSLPDRKSKIWKVKSGKRN